jgi:hypothetical protein
MDIEYAYETKFFSLHLTENLKLDVSIKKTKL